MEWEHEPEVSAGTKRFATQHNPCGLIMSADHPDTHARQLARHKCADAGRLKSRGSAAKAAAAAPASTALAERRSAAARKAAETRRRNAAAAAA